MPFKITIEETKSVPSISRQDDLTEERHYTDEEIADSHRFMHESDKTKFMKKIYKTTEVPSTKEISTKVFEQVVETLDLKSVIGAINK